MVRPAAPATVMMLLAATERLFADAKVLDVIMLQLGGDLMLLAFWLGSTMESRNIALS
jgi:hypothetical protein